MDFYANPSEDSRNKCKPISIFAACEKRIEDRSSKM